MKTKPTSLLFLGLLLLFFNINMNHLNVVTTFIGVVLVAVAVERMSAMDHHFQLAFRFGLGLMGLKTLSLVVFCMEEVPQGVTVGLTAATLVAMILFLRQVFKGLEVLALQAALEDLAKRLRNCLPFYVAGVVATLGAMVLPALAILAFALVVIGLGYILVQVGRVGSALEEGDITFPEGQRGGLKAGLLCAYIVVTAGLCFTVLQVKSAPGVSGEVYNPRDLTDVQDISAVRALLGRAGLPREILDDLPDSEVVRYEGVAVIHSQLYQQDTDGGTVALTKCVADLGGGRLRQLFYYKWVKLPDHRYVDQLETALSWTLFTSPMETDFSGFSLYDKAEASGQATYKAAFIQDGQPLNSSGQMGMMLRYRVLGKTADNQRGYFAYNVQVSKPEDVVSYNTVVNYLHQQSMLRFSTQDVRGNSQSLMTLYQQDSAVDRFQMLYADDFSPLGLHLLRGLERVYSIDLHNIRTQKVMV